VRAGQVSGRSGRHPEHVIGQLQQDVLRPAEASPGLHVGQAEDLGQHGQGHEAGEADGADAEAQLQHRACRSHRGGVHQDQRSAQRGSRQEDRLRVQLLPDGHQD